MALGDLTQIEKRNEYYTNIQLGKDVKTQTALISKSTKAMIASHIASTNAIIASQESIRDGIDNLSYGIAEVSEGIQGLKAAFEFGISEVVWQIEQNRVELQNILNVLMAPLDTQGKELRRRAEDAYANGWYDDALEDFLESERKNKYDFAVHISIGMLYLFQKGDRTKAQESFEKAVKYASPKSKYHASLSLLYLALIKRDLNQIAEAEKLTAEAIELTPDFEEALYQNAQYNGKLKNVQKCIKNLSKAINKDKLYCIKADKDEMFDSVRSQVNQLFEKLRSDEATQAATYFKKVKEKHDKVMPLLKDVSKDNITDVSFIIDEAIKVEYEYNQLNTKRARNSYFDLLDVNNALPLLQKRQASLIQNIKEKVTSAVESRKRGINEAKNEHKSRVGDYLGITGGVIIVGSFAVPVLGVLFLFPGFSKLWALLFCIPIISQICSGLMVFDVITNSNAALTSGGLRPYENKVGWLIIIFIIVSAIYFFVSRASSKSKMMNEVNSNTNAYDIAAPYLDRLKEL